MKGQLLIIILISFALLILSGILVYAQNARQHHVKDELLVKFGSDAHDSDFAEENVLIIPWNIKERLMKV